MYPFQQFQNEFGRHIRDPRHQPRPDGVPRRRMAVYNDLLYNNIESFLLACFPLTHELLGARRWPRLVRAFFTESRSQTPLFREIPREFLQWLQQFDAMTLPPWLRELAFYEWSELAVDIANVSPGEHDPHGDLLSGRPLLTPALMNMTFHWPVHRIGVHYRPRKPSPDGDVFLLVYRDAADEVGFIELNAMSSRLVDLLAAGEHSGEKALQQLAQESEREADASFIAHGRAMLENLRDVGVILGAARRSDS